MFLCSLSWLRVDLLFTVVSRSSLAEFPFGSIWSNTHSVSKPQAKRPDLRRFRKLRKPVEFANERVQSRFKADLLLQSQEAQDIFDADKNGSLERALEMVKTKEVGSCLGMV